MAGRTGPRDDRTDLGAAVARDPLRSARASRAGPTSARYIVSVRGPVTLYLFDIDGTLLRARGSGARAFDEVLAAQHGIAEACRGMRFGGKTDPALLDEVLMARRGHGATASEREAFLLAYVPRLEVELVKRGVDVLPGAVEALRYLAVLSDVRLGWRREMCARAPS